MVRTAAAGPVTTRMTFALRVDPGGPMAPMIDALMKPAMAAAAEKLALQIVAHLEAGAAHTACLTVPGAGPGIRLAGEIENGARAYRFSVTPDGPAARLEPAR